MLIHVLLLTCLVVPACLVAGYYLGLVAARLMGLTASSPPSQECIHTFVIVIPAHNEETTIGQCLHSCLALDYPTDKQSVVVVADNCTDATAAIAQHLGIECLERTDSMHRGKGHALEWAFDRLAERPHDAVLVIDSDCLVDRESLRVLDGCLAQGSKVIQLNHVVANADAGPSCYAARVGQLLEYDFGYDPKSRLGLWVPLVGTGMAFHRSLLAQHPWTSRSVVEDIEYSLLLAEHGIRVRFVANAAVRHQAEQDLYHVSVQRRRWARGTLGLSKRKAILLAVKGVIQRRRLVADAGWTLLTMSRPLVLLHLALTLAVTISLALCLRDVWSSCLATLSAGAGLAQGAYYATGILALGLTRRRIWLLACAPIVAAGLAWIALRSLFESGKPTWDRTPRSSQLSRYDTSN